MGKIIVAVFQGKGRGHADSISIMLFDSEENANQFITEAKNLESKYWTFAEIVKEGETFDTYYND